jgi:hypothetical protein
VGAGVVTSSLASRLEDIPGVASVVVDLDGFGRGIDVRLEPGADEAAVMERLRALLAAYGIRRDRGAPLGLGRAPSPLADLGIEVAITPVDSGARIEVGTASVKSFRIVAATPLSVAQGLVDAWCQVVGRVPIEVVKVTVEDDELLVVTASDGEHETVGSAPIRDGWLVALTGAIRGLLGDGGVTDLRSVAS